MRCPDATSRIFVRTFPSWRLGLLAAGLYCLGASGCGGVDYQVAPVSGQVTLDGKPVANVHVGFQPISDGNGKPNPGPGSFAVTDGQGHYELRLVSPDMPGCVVGRHRVRLSMNRPDQDPASDEIDVSRAVRSVLPPSAGDGSLQFTVPPEGTDAADFHLESRR